MKWLVIQCAVSLMVSSMLAWFIMRVVAEATWAWTFAMMGFAFVASIIPDVRDYLATADAEKGASK